MNTTRTTSRVIHLARLGFTVAAIVSVSACANMNQRDRNTTTGAAIGAAAGAVLTGGSGVGTVGGAAVGGVIGNQVGQRR